MATVPAVPLAPALAAKPVVAAASSPSPSTPVGTPGSVTSKEWVIPPRPKPGRKPATDTPPTKRKAQNRAAQRAFRERRAARVNELEDQIKEIEEEHEMQLTTFKDQIKNLSQEVEQCRNETNWWRDRCQALEKEVSIERNANEALAKELRSSNPEQNSVNLPRLRKSTRTGPSDAEVNELGQDRHRDNSAGERGNVPLGCGNCMSTHCQCIEDAFRMPGIEEQEKSHSKGTGSPNSGTSRKVQSEPEIKTEPEEMEIDFTTRFANTQPQTNSSNTVSSPPVDPCGFCQDGTPCICAEMAAQEEQRPQRDTFDNNRLAPIQNLSQFTPPPSEGDVRSEVTLPPISEATNPCANGPGTCAQCLSDPRSTLFCKSLAASRSGSAAPSGCCGGKGSDGGCCQSRNSNPPRDPAPIKPPLHPLTQNL
ncbi:bZIP transcription factor HapX [Aspergillus sclerotialis]|uniref:BZIP transcription factor HapX n=1 Tax=Aspergillus sclerotialis TaxID=2070753 RepID=A0A3A2ZSL0_9EURO|nr:bZIP transcription factor HapX [Aspergillus sclerotialis]